MAVCKIISGGQTGADLAGLVVGKRLKLQTGGTAAKDWMTEKGSQPILKEYGLVECKFKGYPPRTRLNVIESSVTIIFAQHEGSAGTAQTIKLCKFNNRDYIVLNPWHKDAKDRLREFLIEKDPLIINIAGNRESKSPGICKKSIEVLECVLSVIELG